MKRILSIPINAPDPAVYVLTGFIPIKGQIDQKVLTLFNNITRQADKSIEKQLAKRQLTLKDNTSNSWFIAARRILHQYDLPNTLDLLEHPISKQQWKLLVKKSVNSYWKKKY